MGGGIKRAKRSHHKADSCVRAAFPRGLGLIYFRLPSNSYRIYSGEHSNMGNRLFLARRGGWKQGAGGGGEVTHTHTHK